MRFSILAAFPSGRRPGVASHHWQGHKAEYNFRKGNVLWDDLHESGRKQHIPRLKTDERWFNAVACLSTQDRSS